MIVQKKEDCETLKKLCQIINLGDETDNLCSTIEMETYALKSYASRTHKEKEEILVSSRTLTDLNLKDNNYIGHMSEGKTNGH